MSRLRLRMNDYIISEWVSRSDTNERCEHHEVMWTINKFPSARVCIQFPLLLQSNAACPTHHAAQQPTPQLPLAQSGAAGQVVMKIQCILTCALLFIWNCNVFVFNELPNLSLHHVLPLTTHMNIQTVHHLPKGQAECNEDWPSKGGGLVKRSIVWCVMSWKESLVGWTKHECQWNAGPAGWWVKREHLWSLEWMYRTVWRYNMEHNKRCTQFWSHCQWWCALYNAIQL